MNSTTNPVVRYWRQSILAVLLFACGISHCSLPARAEPIPSLTIKVLETPRIFCEGMEP